MKKKSKYIVLFVSLVAIGFAASSIVSKIKVWYEVDVCLDKGGSWNYELHSCDFKR